MLLLHILLCSVTLSQSFTVFSPLKTLPTFGTRRFLCKQADICTGSYTHMHTHTEPYSTYKHRCLRSWFWPSSLFTCFIVWRNIRDHLRSPVCCWWPSLFCWSDQAEDLSISCLSFNNSPLATVTCEGTRLTTMTSSVLQTCRWARLNWLVPCF